ncbi:hypothetical protein HKX48_007068 [Thoreauomyces humboldtii]|nr:hypothetical protein HKX48_007068 [Thoreauomyces humboldtii]
MSVATKSEILDIYRGILREVARQFTRRNNNDMWHKEVVSRFRVGSTLSGRSEIETQLKHARNVHAMMRSNHIHRGLVTRYWPVSGMTEEQRLTKTANTVGLSMPKLFGSAEALADEPWGSRMPVTEEPLSPHVEEALKIIKGSS